MQFLHYPRNLGGDVEGGGRGRRGGVGRGEGKGHKYWERWEKVNKGEGREKER